MSIVFLFDENPDVASAGSGGAAVGGARSVPDHAAHSLERLLACPQATGQLLGLKRLRGPIGAGKIIEQSCSAHSPTTVLAKP